MRQPAFLLQCIRRSLNSFLDDFSVSIHRSAFYLGMATLAKTRFCSHRHFISTCLRRHVVPVGFRISTHPCLGQIRPASIQYNLEQCSRRLMRLSLTSYQREINKNNELIIQRTDELKELCSAHQYDSIRRMIHFKNRELTTILDLDREELCPGSSAPCEIEVNAIELGTREVITVKVTINDINDHAPQFSDDVINIPIPESVSTGTRFPLSAATDEDVGENGIQGYRLSDEYADTFGLVQNEYPGGLIIIQLEVLGSLDRESKDNYQMTLYADDGGDPVLSGVTTLNVTVLDSDDHSPVFDRSSYQVSVAESIGVGQQIIQVRASDPDTGTNGQIIYDFGGSVSAKILELFEVDSESGWLSVKSELDFEDESSHQVSIRATNNVPNPLPDFTTVTVNLIDVNDNKPRLTISALGGGGRFKHIAENSPADEDVAYVRVTDADTGINSQATLTLEDDFGHFYLEAFREDQYFLKTAVGLNREDIDFYNITILAEDRGTPVLTSRKRFEVFVDDENDNSPTFSSSRYHATISENNEPGHRVATVQASDEDEFENGEVVYSLLDDKDGAFGIHPVNGVLTANVTLDREVEDSIDLMIRACDRGQPQRCSDVPLTVRVLDMNDNGPTFGGDLIELRIDENQQSGTIVGRAIATDADEGDNSRLRYSILTDAVFRIDEDSGRIYSTAELDREIQELYHFTVSAVDHGLSPKTATATVVVTVDDVNDHSPEFTVPSANNDIRFIPVSADPGLPIITVQSEDEDKDENAAVSYAISHGNTYGAFGIQANGQVVTAQDLEPMWEGVHDITIRATDGGNPSTSSTTVLRVVVANEDFKKSLPPANFTALFNLTIDYYLNLGNSAATSRGILNDWPMIVIISLAGSAVILVIVFLLVAARCRTKNREQGKYIVPSGEELFASRQAPKPADNSGKMSDSDSGLTSTASNSSNIPSKNIRKWRAQQERDRESMGSSNPGSTTNLGSMPPGITGAANVDMRLGNRQMTTFGSNSDLHSESIASITSARRTPDPDAEVQRLLRKLRRDSEDRNSEGGSGSSYDSGHGGDREMERESGWNQNRTNLSSADGSSRRSASYPRIAALAAQNINNSQTPSGGHRHSYMASPHCTPECLTLGHSDECWMPNPSSISKSKTVHFSKYDDNRSSGGSYRSYQSNADRPPATSPKPPNPAIAFGNVSKVTPNHKPIPKGSNNAGLGQQPPATRDVNGYYGSNPAVIVEDERNGNAMPLTPIREHPYERRSSQDTPSVVVTKPSPDKYKNNNDVVRNGDVKYRNDLNRGHANGVSPLHRNSINGTTPNGALPNGLQNGTRSNSRNSSGDSHNSSSDSVGTYSSSSAASNEMTPVRYSPDEVEAVLEKCGGDRTAGVSADGDRMYTDWV